MLRDEGAIDERESFIDAMFAAAKGGGDAVWLTKRGEGVQILAISEFPPILPIEEGHTRISRPPETSRHD